MSGFPLVGFLTSLLLATTASAAPLPPASTMAARAAYDLRTPLAFEANRGQADPSVRFLARGAGYAMLLTPDEIVLALRRAPAAAPARVRMRFVGGTPAPALAGLEPFAGRSNYLIGSDPARWQTGVPRFGRVTYRHVYPGVDAVFYGNQRRLEYDLVVAPGTDPASIVLGLRGAERVAIDDTGALVLHTADGEVTQDAPLIYQEVNGERRVIDGAFARLGRRGDEERIGFRVARYDPTRPLVIDPVLNYATYLGGDPNNDGRGIAIDDDGNAYVTGNTLSATFPTVGGLPSPNDMLGGSQDAFVTKYGPTGAVVYSTYLGGGGSEQGHAIAADADGNAYVTGETASADFPTEGGLAAPYDALQGSLDAFVTKLDPEGDALVYSTYLGGTASFDVGRAIVVDATKNAYVTGTTQSGDFPTAGTLMNNVNHGITDVFVSKFAADGASLGYSIHVGGTGAETGFGIAIRSGEAYVTGSTQSTDFPLVSGLPAPNNGRRGASDGFATKVNAAGSALVYSTYLSGGSDVDQGNAIAVDTSGNAYVGGQTQSNNLLHTTATAGSLPSPNSSFRGGADGYVVKLGTAGSTIGFFLFLGGSQNGQDDGINGIGLDGDGNVYVTGQTDTLDFPVVNGLPFQNRRGGSNDAAIVTKIAAAGNALVYSTYLGGTAGETGRGIAVDATGIAYVVGQTFSGDFPVVNAAQPMRGSTQFNADAFVAKIAPGQPAGFAYTEGNVFVSAPGFGEVRELTPDGTLVRGLPVPSGAFANGTSVAGSAFDAAGRLYVADMTQNSVFRFDANGVFDETFASGIDASPQALVFDQAGNLFVSTTLGDNDVLKLSSTGMLLDQYDVVTHTQNSQWIDLAADQHTLFFTSGAEDVAVFDLDTDTQLDDAFVAALATTGVRLLPGGQFLVAEGEIIERVNASGNVGDDYLDGVASDLFAISRDPDGDTFWAAGQGISEAGIVYRVDLSDGSVDEQFEGAPPVGILGPLAIAGLSVFGELTEARSGGPAPTPTGPTPTATPTITPTQTPAPEICDDCFDNDLDDDVDRDDADCPARADGMGQGFDDPKGIGKAISKCAKATGKAGAKFEAAKLKGLHKCLLAILVCVQQKPGDAACLDKSAGKCTKAFGKLPKDRGKVTTTVTKGCALPLDPGDLLISLGLGYSNETANCAAHGVTPLSTASDIASCIAAEHECRVEDLVGAELPRAAELLALAGLDPGDFPCLGAGADGGGDELDPTKVKLAVKCAQAIAKAGAKFVSAKLKLAQKCAGSVYDCLQKKPGDAKCPPKAEKTCIKQLAKLTAPGKGAAAKHAAAIAKGCTKAPLTLADVLADDGLGFGALGGECAAIGVPSLASVADLSTCLERRHECRVEQMLETQMPRLEELLDAGGIALP